MTGERMGKDGGEKEGGREGGSEQERASSGRYIQTRELKDNGVREHIAMKCSNTCSSSWSVFSCYRR